MLSLKASPFQCSIGYQIPEWVLLYKGQVVSVVGISLVDVVKDDWHLHCWRSQRFFSDCYS